MYHATKWGIEGFVESVSQEVASFGIGMTIVEPGGARTEFRTGSAQIVKLMPVYDDTPAHGFLKMLEPTSPPAPGDPARMAARIIESVDAQPAPLRLVLGSMRRHSWPHRPTFLLSDPQDLRPRDPPDALIGRGLRRLQVS